MNQALMTDPDALMDAIADMCMGPVAGLRGKAILQAYEALEVVVTDQNGEALGAATEDSIIATFSAATEVLVHAKRHQAACQATAKTNNYPVTERMLCERVIELVHAVDTGRFRPYVKEWERKDTLETLQAEILADVKSAERLCGPPQKTRTFASTTEDTMEDRIVQRVIASMQAAGISGGSNRDKHSSGGGSGSGHGGRRWHTRKELGDRDNNPDPTLFKWFCPHPQHGWSTTHGDGSGSECSLAKQ
jgi:hypothetical protein